MQTRRAGESFASRAQFKGRGGVSCLSSPVLRSHTQPFGMVSDRHELPTTCPSFSGPQFTKMENAVTEGDTKVFEGSERFCSHERMPLQQAGRLANSSAQPTSGSDLNFYVSPAAPCRTISTPTRTKHCFPNRSCHVPATL